MKSQFERLQEGHCERCQHVHDLVTVRSNGEEYEVCRACATRIQVGRAA